MADAERGIGAKLPVADMRPDQEGAIFQTFEVRLALEGDPAEPDHPVNMRKLADHPPEIAPHAGQNTALFGGIQFGHGKVQVAARPAVPRCQRADQREQHAHHRAGDGKRQQPCDAVQGKDQPRLERPDEQPAGAAKQDLAERVSHGLPRW